MQKYTKRAEYKELLVFYAILHLQRNDATTRWEDSENGGKRIIRQILRK